MGKFERFLHYLRRFLIILICGIFGSGVLYTLHEHFKHPEPPPGWTIVIDQKGNYGAKDQDGYVFDGLWPMRSKQEAINRAWRRVAARKEEADKVWQEVKE